MTTWYFSLSNHKELFLFSFDACYYQDPVGAGLQQTQHQQPSAPGEGPGHCIQPAGYYERHGQDEEPGVQGEVPDTAGARH